MPAHFKNHANARTVLIVMGLVLPLLVHAPPARAQQDSNTAVQSSWVAGLKQMTAQMGAILVQQMGVLGTMYDGQSSNAAILAQQKLAAQAYATYTPGETLCRIGTITRSLASSDQARGQTTSAVHQILLNRETHNTVQGQPYADYTQIGTLKQYAKTYCNPGDNDGMTVACPKTGAIYGPARFNRDIDFTRLVIMPRTLNLNFSDGTLTPDEQDVLAFTANLSAFQPLPSLSSGMTTLNTSPAVLNHIQTMRSLTASRGAVRASVANVVAQKSPGGPGSSLFMANILREMGMSDAEAARFLTGAAAAPSYDAQMEILTKKIYQNPNFYTNLVDKPDGVARTQASLAAIKLMQGRDLVESSYRRELLLAQLLESRLKDEETALVNDRLTRARTR